MASDTLATIHPSNGSSSIWITANVIASTTAATSSVGIGVFKALNCTSQVGTTVTSTFDRAGSAPAAYNITLNVVDAPATTAAQTYYLCADYATGVANLPYGELTLQEIRAGSDIAEDYNAATDTPLTAGDIVSLDPTIQDGVQPSTSPYDSTLVGIVSTQPGAVLGNASPEGSQVLVALAGRVPVHVTNENGNITVGDELTSSDIPGVAMRATEPGRVVGVAMENFAPDPSVGTTTGSILAFVNPGWSLGSLTNPADIASSSWALENASSSGPQFVLDQFTAYVQAALAKLGVAIQNGIVTLQQLIANKVTTNVLCVQGTCVTGDELQNLLDRNGVGNSDATTSNTTSSASGGGSDMVVASSTSDGSSSTSSSDNVSSTPDGSSNADSTTDISSDSTATTPSGGGSSDAAVTNPSADDSALVAPPAAVPAPSDDSSDSSGAPADSGT